MCGSSLLLLLAATASAYPHVTLYYGHTVKAIDKSGLCQIETFPDHFSYETQFDLVIGADGTLSTTRAEILKYGRFDYSQVFIRQGYKVRVWGSSCEKRGEGRREHFGIANGLLS